MLTLTKLSATPIETNFVEPRGILQCVHWEPKRGFICRINLGEAGLVMTRGKDQVAIPLEEIAALCAAHNPALAHSESES